MQFRLKKMAYKFPETEKELNEAAQVLQH